MNSREYEDPDVGFGDTVSEILSTAASLEAIESGDESSCTGESDSPGVTTRTGLSTVRNVVQQALNSASGAKSGGKTPVRVLGVAATGLPTYRSAVAVVGPPDVPGTVVQSAAATGLLTAPISSTVEPVSVPGAGGQSVPTIVQATWCTKCATTDMDAKWTGAWRAAHVNAAEQWKPVNDESRALLYLRHVGSRNQATCTPNTFLHYLYGFYNLGNSRKELARVYHMFETTIGNWIRVYKATGTFERARKASDKKFSSDHRAWLCDFYGKHPPAYLDEAQEAFVQAHHVTISKSSVWRIIHDFGVAAEVFCT
ncbi:hypothetical protein PC115_g19213 [Phytophthora cactorum]|uniref:Uncharacterized protein n=1 Tax=Phytophthora cactorum TaxID=29920 RepID=A0A8T1AZF9_9STRA|nr:hypothetical protein PC115_g19213 [Phytophthora cactorum]